MTDEPSNNSLDDETNAARVNLKTSVAGILVFGGAVLIYHLFWLVMEGIGGNIYERVSMQIDYLPTLVAEEPEKRKVIVFGSSMVQAGFDPVLFDNIMKEKNTDVISYNYGIGNMNPEFQELISRRIKDQFDSQDKKLDLAIIEFNPFQATTVRKQSTKAMDEQNIAVLSNNKEIWAHTLKNPTTGIRMFTIRHLRRGVSAELFAAIPTMMRTEGVAIERSEEYQQKRQQRSELEGLFFASFSKDVPDRKNLAWDPATRGARLDKTQFTEETLDLLKKLYDQYRYDGFLEADLIRRTNTADIIELGFDESLIESFVKIVKNFQSVSNHVEVILLPKNTDWIHYSPEVQARLNKVFESIGERTGATLKNFQVHPDITPEHFRDTTHLSSYDGVDIFTKILADEYEGILSD